MNELPVIGYPCLRKEFEAGIVWGQTLQVARRKCIVTSCYDFFGGGGGGVATTHMIKLFPEQRQEIEPSC